MIQDNDLVVIDYSVSTVDGTLLDSSPEDEPLQALLGSGFLIQGLEEALIGRESGEHFSVTIEAEKAYGERHESLIQSVPKSLFDGMEVEPGMSFRANTDEGEQSVIVIEVNEDNVVVDGNHPLSGMDLVFDVTIVSVKGTDGAGSEGVH